MVHFRRPLFLSLLFLWTALVLVEGASPTRTSNRASRAKNRGKQSRQHDHQTCHLKEIDACLDKIQLLAKGPSPSSIITTDHGLDKLCS